MKVVDRAYVEAHKNEIVGAIRSGALFIYPTDTIYGLGCNALHNESVLKIRELKQRDTKPFSVIAPSKAWIGEHCEIEASEVDTYLPGPYTLFVRRKDSAVASLINPNDNTLGVRIPKHWFSELVTEAGVPFVTTSVNLSGRRFMTRPEEVSEEFGGQVDFCIDEGEIAGQPSQKISLL